MRFSSIGIREASIALCVLCSAVAGCEGCDDDALSEHPDAGELPMGLTPQQAARVIAKVGDREITLGDYAATLARMDQFDRLRYQTKERRRELLEEMIDVELLAIEARRRGLDKQPAVEESVRQILRDALLAEQRDTLPPPGEIKAEEVAAYYKANVEKYREPERRRVSAIVLENADKAKEALEKVMAIKEPREWGIIYDEFSVNAPKKRSPGAPMDLAGDLGIVGPADDEKAANTLVPPRVRDVLFQMKAVGDIYPEVLNTNGKFFIIRLSGITQSHHRSLEEADRSIRVAIIQAKMREQEQNLERDLRAKFSVEISDEALKKVPLPPPLKNLKDNPAPPEQP